MSAKTFSVYLNGKLLERLEGGASDTAATVRRRLIEREFYDERIRVCIAKTAKGSKTAQRTLIRKSNRCGYCGGGNGLGLVGRCPRCGVKRRAVR